MRVALLGLSIEHPQAVSVAFRGDDDLQAYDMLVWSPDGMLAEYADAGLERLPQPLLSPAGSVALLADARRRRGDLRRFLAAGRVIVVVPPLPESLWVHVIEDVQPFDALELLPVRGLRPRAAAGAQGMFRAGQPFADFIAAAPYTPQIQATFADFPGVCICFAAPDGAAAGGYVYHHPGHVLLLPLPADEAPAARTQLLKALLSLGSRLEQQGATTILAPWAEAWRLPGEAALRERLRVLRAEGERVRQDLEQAEGALAQLFSRKALLGGHGGALLSATAEACEALGAVATAGYLGMDSLVIEDGARAGLVLLVEGDAHPSPATTLPAATLPTDTLSRLDGLLRDVQQGYRQPLKGILVSHDPTAAADGTVVNGTVADSTVTADALAERRVAEAGHCWLMAPELLALAQLGTPEAALELIFSTRGRPAPPIDWRAALSREA